MFAFNPLKSATATLALVVTLMTAADLAAALPAPLVEADSAALVQRSTLISWGPTITAPSAGQVAVAGKSLTVEWKTDNIPPEKQNGTVGAIKLGYEPADGSGGENLYWTLFSGTPALPYTRGEYTVTLPSDLQERDDYIINVFGTSGTVSDKFTIKPAA